ncbi:MAG: T9SS type A sorting domain-containing protein, partial [Bacteroidales bacterium]|nr:T9SS type A sorting domain-containing protein [Bacteroidales bacterium]
ALNQGIYEIPLIVRNQVEGEVSIEFDLTYFSSDHSVYFEDKVRGVMLNLREDNTYRLEADATGGDINDRFVLSLYSITTDIEQIGENEVEAGRDIQIKAAGSMALISVSSNLISEGPGVIEIYSMSGRKLQEVPAHSSRTLIILPQESGVYIIRARFGKVVKSERVVTAGNFE